MLKAEVRVFDVTRYQIYHLSTIQRLRDSNQATGIVKNRLRSGQPRLTIDVKTATYVNCIDDVYIDNIRSSWLPSVPDECEGSKCNSFQIFNKKKYFNHNKFKSCAISKQISNCNFIIYGYCFLIECCSSIFIILL